jgi:hypothetical protein
MVSPLFKNPGFINGYSYRHCEGEKNTRRGVELCFGKFFVSPKKTEHTDQKLSETASEVVIRI